MDLKKTLYYVCLIFSFTFILFCTSSVLVFTFYQDEKNYRKIETVVIENLKMERREDERNLVYYFQDEETLTLQEVVVLSYSIYDQEKRSFVFIVEDQSTYFHATVNQSGEATGIRIPKKEKTT